ncbi:MAG TPA: DUF4007 family protein [Pyrinomonadaceae bacterium]|nr:DUF4007 family protein [Pyrinomonadaceae bacterium]
MPSIKQSRLPGVITKPEIFSFSGHETFVFRYGWMKKGVDACADDPKVFSDDTAIVTLGVGKNMVRSIRHWGLAAGVIEEEVGSRGTRLHPTELGEFLFGHGGHDQYLEDPNTLWLLHWNILSNPQRCATWHMAFNSLPSNEFTRDQLTHRVEEEVRRRNAKALPSGNTLKRDVEIFLRTYIPARNSRGVVAEDSLDCPLVELHLIEEIPGSEAYQMRRGPKNTLGDQVFTYALIDFWDRLSAQRETLAFPEIAYEKGSPGIAFKLDENSLVERLERLDHITAGDLLYTETAGLKQVSRKKYRPKFEYLEQYYQQTSTLFAVGA